MNKSLLKDSLKEIVKTYKRFISILLIAFLGVGFFAGVRATSPDMELTIDNYFDKQKLYDVRVVSTLGLTDDDLEEINKIENIEKAIGIFSEDVYVSFEDEETVVKTYSLDDEINILEVLEGRLPENEEECVIEKNMEISKNVSIGDFLEIKEELSDDKKSSFKNTKLKVVGIVKSPLYISRDRGITTLGSGKISYYIYVNKNNIISDIYTEIDVMAKGATKLNTIGNEYKDLIEKLESNLENIKENRQKARYNELIKEANEKLEDAQKEFDEQKLDAEEKIAEAEQKINKGKQEIKKAENEIADGEKKLKDSRETAKTEFAQAEQILNEAQNEIILSQEALNDSKIYFEAKKKEAEEGKKQIQIGIDSINLQIENLEKQKKQLEEADISRRRN